MSRFNKSPTKAKWQVVNFGKKGIADKVKNRVDRGMNLLKL